MSKSEKPGANTVPEFFPFPARFLWGAATSAHQVEGNNRFNDWWEYEQAGRLPYVSGEACRHYELYEQDFDLAHAFGHNAHRLSIEWSRIEPAEGQWNSAAIEHYRSVTGALRRRGLEPIVTLHHFTNPAWFTRSGGWLRRDSANLFARYAALVGQRLGAAVRYWLTINEPTVYVMQAYIHGKWPPLCRHAWVKAAIALANFARAHRLAYRRLHQVCHTAQVGFAHSAPVIMPCNPQRNVDRLAAGIRDFLLNRAFFLLLGASEKKERSGRFLDYLGINYYTRTIIKSAGMGPWALLGRACRSDHHRDRGPISDTGWEVYPDGLESVLQKFSRLGVPLFVTENGVATDDEHLRREFIVAHLQQLAGALAKGINVIGYLYWSLMDNYEWDLGPHPHFGLAAVDPETFERRPRPCVEDFLRACRLK